VESLFEHMALCCGAAPENWFLRLRKLSLLCCINDAVATFFYGTVAFWGYSGAGLAVSADHLCYLRQRYYGHILAGSCCVISASSSAFGSVVAMMLYNRLGYHCFIGRLRDSHLLRLFYLLVLFELLWMWIVYVVEVFVDYTLPMEECHPKIWEAHPARGAGFAFVNVFLTACWGFSFGTRCSAVFYAFEIRTSRCNLEGSGDVQVIGNPIAFAHGDSVLPTFPNTAALALGSTLSAAEQGRPVQSSQVVSFSAADNPLEVGSVSSDTDSGANSAANSAANSSTVAGGSRMLPNNMPSIPGMPSISGLAAFAAAGHLDRSTGR